MPNVSIYHIPFQINIDITHKIDRKNHVDNLLDDWNKRKNETKKWGWSQIKNIKQKKKTTIVVSTENDEYTSYGSKDTWSLSTKTNKQMNKQTIQFIKRWIYHLYLWMSVHDSSRSRWLFTQSDIHTHIHNSDDSIIMSRSIRFFFLFSFLCVVFPIVSN